jgi:hypothetical protein
MNDDATVKCEFPARIVIEVFKICENARTVKNQRLEKLQLT